MAEVVRAWGMKYQAAVQAVKRFREALAGDLDRREFVPTLKREMSII